MWNSPINLSLPFAPDAIGVDFAGDNPENPVFLPPPNPTGSPHNYDITGTGTVLDDSLTIAGPNGIVGSAELDKVGGGQLILPTANTTFTGNTVIKAGWITIENSESLGGWAIGKGQGVQATTTVIAGAALHLLPLSGNMTLTNNFNLQGSGISDPAYPLVDDTNSKTGGALMNLAGNNTIQGNIVLNQQVNIGVEQIYSGNPSDPNYSANAFSQLTLAGQQSDAVSTVINVSGTANGGPKESDKVINTGGTSGMITIQFAPHSFPDDLRVYDGDYTTNPTTAVLLYDSSGDYTDTAFNTTATSAKVVNQNGALITINYTNLTSTATAVEQPELGDPTGKKYDLGPDVMTYGPLAGTDIEIIVNQGGRPAGTSTAWTYTAQVVPSVPNNTSGIVKVGSQRLIITGPGTYTGGVVVDAGALRVQNNTALGVGTAATSTTTVNAGASLELAATNPLTNGGTVTGLNVVGEALILNGSGNAAAAGSPLNAQTLALTGMTTASQFTLTFDGATTAPITYTGTAATDATNIQNALNTVLGTLAFSGGSVSVSQSGSGVFTIVFAGTLAGTSQSPILATVTAGPASGSANAYLNLGNDAALVNEGIDPAGLAAPSSLIGDNTWRGGVLLNNSATIDVQTSTRLSIDGVIYDNGPTAGSNLTKTGGGELLLSGSNTYQGVTYINQGTLTAASSAALGAPGVASVQTLIFTGATTGTQYSLTFDGATTPTLTYTNTTADGTNIQNALNALPSVRGSAGGSITVSQSLNAFTFTFGGSLIGFNQPNIGATIVSGPGTVPAQATVQTPGTGGTVVANGAALQLQGSITVAGESLQVQGTGLAETQTLVLSGGTPGTTTFTLSFNGATTSTLTYTGTAADATNIQNALDALLTIGGLLPVAGAVNVSQVQAGVWTLTFGGSLAGTTTNQSPLTLIVTAGSGNSNVLTNLNAPLVVNGQNVSQSETLTLTGATAGTKYTLSFNGATTAQLTYAGTVTDATTMSTALNALPTIAGVNGSVSVIFVKAGTFTLVFGSNLAESLQPAITAAIVSGLGSASALTNVNAQLDWSNLGPAPVQTDAQTAGSQNVTGRITGIAHRSQRSQYDLRLDGGRRRLEDHQRRPDLGQHLRPPGRPVQWRDRHFSKRSPCHLPRHRRDGRFRRFLLRHRRVHVHQLGPDLAAAHQCQRQQSPVRSGRLEDRCRSQQSQADLRGHRRSGNQPAH